MRINTVEIYPHKKKDSVYTKEISENPHINTELIDYTNTQPKSKDTNELIDPHKIVHKFMNI